MRRLVDPDLDRDQRVRRGYVENVVRLAVGGFRAAPPNSGTAPIIRPQRIARHEVAANGRRAARVAAVDRDQAGAVKIPDIRAVVAIAAGDRWRIVRFRSLGAPDRLPRNVGAGEPPEVNRRCNFYPGEALDRLPT